MPTDSPDLAEVFKNGRTFDFFKKKPVPRALLKDAYDLARMAPTSANCQPMRILFLKTEGAKQRLSPALSSTNRGKTLKAPIVAIIAHDLEFHSALPKLYRIPGAENWFAGQEILLKETAFRNGSLQGAYFILAARLVGLDVGPMSGFDNNAVDKEFFTNTSWRSNFLCNLGIGDRNMLPKRDPRLEFNDTCQII